MLVFPISDDAPTGCRFEPLEDGMFRLRFWCENKELHAYPVATEPTEGAYVLLDSFISGGSFAEYLRESMRFFGEKVCLYLRPQAYRFPLPCPDGQGTPIIPEQRDLFRYSETLLCLWRICTGDGVYMELADCDRSLREKYRLAEEIGLPLLIADAETLEKAAAEKG